MLRSKLSIGDIFGDWTVVEIFPGRYGQGTRPRCRCICGIERTVAKRSLQNGSSESCGCRRKRLTMPVEQRFWKFVEKRGDDDCWPWLGGTNIRGYGRFRSGGAAEPMIGAHRYSLSLSGVEVPAGLVVMHSCDNPSCVNPRHLSLGTVRDNTRDAMQKGRMRNYFTEGYDVRRFAKRRKRSANVGHP